jgi:glycosyltransferase involved in cell wall biosynthesis
MSPEKRIDRAIEIACRAGLPLKIAAKIYPEEKNYFEETLAPLIHAAKPLVEFVGEIGDRERDELLGNAAALLFPIEWPEPFGLVMSEALAWRNLGHCMASRIGCGGAGRWGDRLYRGQHRGSGECRGEQRSLEPGDEPERFRATV